MSHQQNDELLELAREHIDRPSTINGDVAMIPLGKNGKYGYALVDSDFAWLDKYKWTLGKNGYAVKDPNFPNYLMHHNIIGPPAKGFEVDHKNRIRTDNRLKNLRFVNRSQNCWNASISSNNKSGHKGVCWDGTRNRWRVTLRANGKLIANNYSKTLKEAVARRHKLERIHHVTPK